MKKSTSRDSLKNATHCHNDYYYKIKKRQPMAMPTWNCLRLCAKSWKPTKRLATTEFGPSAALTNGATNRSVEGDEGVTRRRWRCWPATAESPAASVSSTTPRAAPSNFSSGLTSKAPTRKWTGGPRARSNDRTSSRASGRLDLAAGEYSAGRDYAEKGSRFLEMQSSTPTANSACRAEGFAASGSSSHASSMIRIEFMTWQRMRIEKPFFTKPSLRRFQA